MAPLVKMISRGDSADQVRDLLAGLVDGLFGGPSELVVAAGGVAEMLREIRQHGIEYAGVHAGCSVIIEINGRRHCCLFFKT